MAVLSLPWPASNGNLTWTFTRELRRDFPQIDICEVRYESFCENPIRELKRIAGHCELSWPKEYERAIRKQYVESENEKWKQDLTAAQQDILEEVLHPYLVKYGYEPRDVSKQTGPPEARSANHVSV